MKELLQEMGVNKLAQVLQKLEVDDQPPPEVKEALKAGTVESQVPACKEKVKLTTTNVTKTERKPPKFDVKVHAT